MAFNSILIFAWGFWDIFATNLMIKRSNPLASRIGIVLTMLFLGALGFSLWKDRGLAFSPGQVTGMQQEGVMLQGFKSHADFEKECRYCHLPLEATVGDMCLRCHTKIGSEMSKGEGLHAQLKNAVRCQVCHSDHQGRDFNPTLAAVEFFDHGLARFSLVKHETNYDGTDMDCAACHSQGDYGSVADGVCQDCHAGYDPDFMQLHNENYGEECQACHDGLDRMSNFDHGQVFLLEGRHGEIECAECHAKRVFAGTPKQCVACHMEPESHAGLFGLECGACHTATAWIPATLLEHSFPLRHGLESGEPPTACATCHATSYVEYTCYGCHEHQADEMAQKHSEEGITAAELPACVNCHPGGGEAEGGDD